MDFANLAAQLNAGRILPEGIVIVTIMVILVGDLIVGRDDGLVEVYSYDDSDEPIHRHTHVILFIP